MKSIKMIPYHLKTAFRNIKRNPAMAISSATAVTITLILVMVFLIIAVNVQSISTSVEESLEIFVQLDALIDDQEEFDRIQAELEAIDHITDVEFSSKDEQMEIFLESDLGGAEYESIFAEENPLSAAFFIEVDDGENLNEVAEACLEIEGVIDAEYGGESAESLIDAFESIRIGGTIFVLALCLLAIFLISNTIKMTIQSRKDSIAIMRDVGASNGFIKVPFVFEGIIISVLGSIIPIALSIWGYNFIYEQMGGVLFTSLLKMEAPFPFVVYLSLILLGIGIVVGMLGSLFSVSKYLKWKR